MGIWQRLFGNTEPRTALVPLYNAVVQTARTPAFYSEGAVPDTLDGRFDMVALVLSLVLFRLEALGDEGAAPAALVTEVFVNDMDGQLREMGIEYTVGKHIGKMMSALGGRLTAYRDVRDDDKALSQALVRNVYRGTAPDDDALGFMTSSVRALDKHISAQPLSALLAGTLS